MEFAVQFVQHEPSATSAIKRKVVSLAFAGACYVPLISAATGSKTYIAKDSGTVTAGMASERVYVSSNCQFICLEDFGPDDAWLKSDPKSLAVLSHALNSAARREFSSNPPDLNAALRFAEMIDD